MKFGYGSPIPAWVATAEPAAAFQHGHLVLTAGWAGLGLVGLARSASVHLMPQIELFMIYLIMALVLLFRPEGLFKRETARRI